MPYIVVYCEEIQVCNINCVYIIWECLLFSFGFKVQSSHIIDQMPYH